MKTKNERNFQNEIRYQGNLQYIYKQFMKILFLNGLQKKVLNFIRKYEQIKSFYY